MSAARTRAQHGFSGQVQVVGFWAAAHGRVADKGTHSLGANVVVTRISNSLSSFALDRERTHSDPARVAFCFAATFTCNC